MVLKVNDGWEFVVNAFVNVKDVLNEKMSLKGTLIPWRKLIDVNRCVSRALVTRGDT